MKYSLVILWIICFCSAPLANAQSRDIEKEIRDLEQTHCKVIVNHDTAAFFKIWEEDFIVNRPRNDMMKLEATRAGLIDYSLFEGNLEEIKVFKYMVITMVMNVSNR